MLDCGTPSIQSYSGVGLLWAHQLIKSDRSSTSPLKEKAGTSWIEAKQYQRVK